MLDEYLNKKLSHKNTTVFLSAILCGVAMGVVSGLSITLANMTKNVILGRLIYGVAFTGLLFLVILCGYELFTGNTMLLTMVHKKGRTKKIFLNLLLVYAGNLIGCLLLSVVLSLTEIDKTLGLGQYLLNLYTAKTELSIFKMLLLGVLANYLVCMGVYLGIKGKTSLETYVNLFFPIVIFCVLGFEHSVANMFSLFYAAFVNASDITPILINLLFVTVGNIAGGIFFALSTKVKGSAQPQ
jgi:formate/nitrite transporter